jgi:hypothetical protein
LVKIQRLEDIEYSSRLLGILGTSWGNASFSEKLSLCVYIQYGTRHRLEKAKERGLEKTFTELYVL